MIVCPPLPDHPLLTMDDPDNIVDSFMFACRVEDLAAALAEIQKVKAEGLRIKQTST